MPTSFTSYISPSNTLIPPVNPCKFNSLPLHDFYFIVLPQGQFCACGSSSPRLLVCHMYIEMCVLGEDSCHLRHVQLGTYIAARSATFFLLSSVASVSSVWTFPCAKKSLHICKTKDSSSQHGDSDGPTSIRYVWHEEKSRDNSSGEKCSPAEGKKHWTTRLRNVPVTLKYFVRKNYCEYCTI